METYRIYHVGSGGRLRLGDPFQASSDEEAVARARPLLGPAQPAELWQGGRMVGRFARDHAFTRGGG